MGVARDAMEALEERDVLTRLHQESRRQRRHGRRQEEERDED